MRTNGEPGAVKCAGNNASNYLIRKRQGAIRAPGKKNVNGEIANDFMRAGLSRQVSFEQPTLWRNGHRTFQVERLVLLGYLHLCVRILTVTFTRDLLALEKVHLHVLDDPYEIPLANVIGSPDVWKLLWLEALTEDIIYQCVFTRKFILFIKNP